MKLKVRTTLIAGAIAGMLAGPASASSDIPKASAQTSASTKAKTGLPDRDQSAAQPMSKTPRMDAAASARTHDESMNKDSDKDGTAAYGGATASTSIGDNPLYSRSGDDLVGVDVVDSTGDKIGEVIRILLTPDHQGAQAMISVGRIHGMGARDILVSLDELKPMTDKLQMSATKAEIDLLTGVTLDPDKYVEVKGDTPISGAIVEFSAFEQSTDDDQPGATSRTPKGDAVKPATAPKTPKVPQNHLLY